MLSLPVSWLAVAATYMPQPISAIGNFVLAPLLVLDALGSNDPLNQPSKAHLWISFLVCQVLWFWLWAIVVTVGINWLRKSKFKE